MGGTSLPTTSTPGYTAYIDAYGKKWTACKCLAQWLPVYEQLLKAKGLIKSCIDVWQLTGAATASAGTHSQGGVYDLLFQTNDQCVIAAREMGAPAAWRRDVTPTSSWRKTHQHGVLLGCPHNDTTAEYQIVAQRAGYNGLGTNGRLGPDPLKGYPKTYRTWEQGIAWAKAQIAALAPKPPAELKPVTTTLVTDHPYGVMAGEGHTLAATIAPAVDGTIVFDYLKDGKWERFAKVPVKAGVGKATARSTPNFDVSYRAGFDATDNTVFRDGNYSKTIAVPVLRPVDLMSVLQATAQRLAAAEARITELEKPLS